MKRVFVIFVGRRDLSVSASIIPFPLPQKAFNTHAASGNVFRRTYNLIDNKVFSPVDKAISGIGTLLSVLFIVLIVLACLGGLLFVLATFFRVGWKFFKWAWE